MHAPHEPAPLPRAPNGWPQRLFGRWWRRQSPARQDRYATLGPLVSVLLFLAAIISAFWYLRNEELEREQASVKRDTEIAQQQIRLRLIENQEQLVRIAREIGTRAIDQEDFLGQAASFTRERPEITALTWIGANRARRASYSATTFLAETGAAPEPPGAPRPSEPAAAFDAARELRQPVYSRPFTDAAGNAVFQVHVPLIDRAAFAGSLVAEYSVESLMRYFVPAEVSNRHAIALLDASDHVLASTVTTMPGAKPRRVQIVHDVPVAALFREEVASEFDWPRRRYLVLMGAVIALLATVAIGLAYDKRVAAVFVVSSVGVFAVLRLVAAMLMGIASRLPRPRFTMLRLAIANIHRPGALTGLRATESG